MVCRIKLREGEPLGLCIYPGPTFLSLPREIHNKIYKHLLTAPEPIEVWHEPRDNFSSPSPDQPVIRTLTTALLTTHKQIGSEAAAVFYASNTFTFIGSQCWDSLYIFLSSIGATNRSHLRRLEVGVSEPEKLILYPDGTLTSRSWDFWDRKVFARDNYPRNYSRGPNRFGEVGVEHLPPSIEASFRLLGSRQSAARLRLMLNMQFGYAPGAVIMYERGETRCSMELPDHIERMRGEYTVGGNGDKGVQVRWKGRLREEGFREGVESFEKAGWEILETKTRSGLDTKGRTVEPVIDFIMRRKEKC